MATLTVSFYGVLDRVLSSLVDQGYAKTKAEALRNALLHYGEEYGLVRTRLHARAEELAYVDAKGR
jgi:hypothetical protein